MADSLDSPMGRFSAPPQHLADGKGDMSEKRRVETPRLGFVYEVSKNDSPLQSLGTFCKACSYYT